MVAIILRGFDDTETSESLGPNVNSIAAKRLTAFLIRCFTPEPASEPNANEVNFLKAKPWLSGNARLAGRMTSIKHLHLIR